MTPILPRLTTSSRLTENSSITVLASSDSADLGQRLVGHRVVDLEFETLALTDIRDTTMAEAAQRADDRLTLRVEDLGLGHHVHYDAGHGRLLHFGPDLVGA